MRKVIVSFKGGETLELLSVFTVRPDYFETKDKRGENKERKKKMAGFINQPFLLDCGFCGPDDLCCHGDIWYRSKGGGCRILLYAVEPTVC